MDDLSHLPPELAGQIRVELAAWHRAFADMDEDDPRQVRTARLGYLMGALIQVTAHELLRAQRRGRRADWTTGVAVVAALLAAASLLG